MNKQTNKQTNEQMNKSTEIINKKVCVQQGINRKRTFDKSSQTNERKQMNIILGITHL